MAISPIKITRKDSKAFELSINFGNWSLTRETTKTEIEAIEKEILKALDISSIIDNFNCTFDEAKKIKYEWESSERSTSSLCRNCEHKSTSCYDCLFTCQSPLERTLFLSFLNKKWKVLLQQRINKDGSIFDKTTDINKDEILTVPDFYIETSTKKICIYADGATYHYNNEYQGIRDRNIDRELQKLGYVVLRFTGSEIRNKLNETLSIIEQYF